MARNRVDPDQRRIPISATIRDIVQRFVIVEAAQKGLNVSNMLDELLTDALIARDYPEGLLRQAPEEEANEAKKAEVLRQYQKVGNITEAASLARMSLSTVYKWAAEDTSFGRELARIKGTRPGIGGAHRSPSDEMRGYIERQQNGQRRTGGRRKVRVVNPDGSIDESGL